MIISRVVYCADRTIGFNERILTLYNISVASLPLTLLVSCVAVSDTIVELIAGVGLKKSILNGRSLNDIKNQHQRVS